LQSQNFKKLELDSKTPSRSSSFAKRSKNRYRMDGENCSGDDDGTCDTDGSADDGDVPNGVFQNNAAVVSHNNAFCRGSNAAVCDHSENGCFYKVWLYRHAYHNDDYISDRLPKRSPNTEKAERRLSILFLSSQFSWVTSYIRYLCIDRRR
jgi:hypothetical protein